MAKQARAAATRHQVLEGAALSFEKLGYGGASLSGILSYADVTKGALYFHFESKEALAWAVIKEQHAMAMLAAQRVLATAQSPMESILLCAKEMARQLLTEPIVRAGVRLTLELGTSRGPATDPTSTGPTPSSHSRARRGRQENCARPSTPRHSPGSWSVRSPACSWCPRR